MNSPQPLRHFTSRGRIRNWHGAKIKALATATAYNKLDKKAFSRLAGRIANCANRLDFIDDQGNLTLANGYRCKARMCPVCQGSKAREAYAVLAGIVEAHVAEHPTSLPVMLTLTIPNMPADQLHRGRLQIQGPDITQNWSPGRGEGAISYSWARIVPLTKKEGRQALASLENQLTSRQRSIRFQALIDVVVYINRSPIDGRGVDARSWYDRTSGRSSSYRVDIEIISGRAFITP